MSKDKRKKKRKSDEIKSSEFSLGQVQLTQEILSHAIENGHDAVVILGEKYKLEYVSEQGLQLIGDTADNLIGTDFRQFLSEDVAKVAAKRFDDRRRGEDVPDTYPIEMIRRDGTKRNVRIRARVIKGINGSIKTVVNVLDITEETEGQRALQESEERYRTLVETMNDGLAIDDENGCITYANSAFCEMLGISRDEIVGRVWTDFAPNVDSTSVQEKIKDRREGISERYELEWKGKDSRIVPTIISATPYFDSDNKFLGTFAVITEISAQKDAEDTVQFYLDLLTHDIANQLQVIMTSSGLIDNDLPLSYIEEARTDILDAVERCNRLITKVKRAGQLRHIPFTSIDLSAVVKEKVTVLERVYGANVEIAGFKKPVVVLADALLGELVWNLLENAARHNPKSERNVWIDEERENGMVRLSVSDDGPGISKRRKKTVFDKTKRFGGVGLTLVDQMARKYGGRVEVLDRIQGKSNKGAKFVLVLQESS
ncbi:MAG: PAS domain S-box protein [Candidatus Thorarchaeota archaeon]|jgi:PAS domain S-box-containing protein